MKKISIRSAIIIIFVLFNSLKVNASPYMGGQITWECIPSGSPNSGKYIFQVILYRFCPMVNLPNDITISSNSPAAMFQVNRIASLNKDLSPICNADTSFNHINCQNATFYDNLGAVEEIVYRSQPIKLNGIPPQTGWTFSLSGCCRMYNCTNIIITSGYSLKAVMYPYGGQNAYPCFDSSPTFAESPKSVLCTKQFNTIDYLISDIDLDSLVYEWDSPRTVLDTSVTYISNYSYQSPLPSTIQNPNNIPATIDPKTGAISFKSYTVGRFITMLKVTAYKASQKVAEVYREFPIAISDCGTNTQADIIFSNYNSTSQDTIYAFAGESVDFDITSSSFQLLPNNSYKTIELKAYSKQFGDFIPSSVTGSNPIISTQTGCINPPCATLSPACDMAHPITATIGVQTHFSWQTDCGHLNTNSGNNKTTNEYRFTFIANDDYCPVPSQQYHEMIVIVQPKPVPEISTRYIKYNYTSLTVDIGWKKYVGNKFISYELFHSNTINGPYTLLDSIKNQNQIVYSHNIGTASKAYYYLRLKGSFCANKGLSENSDTLSLDITNLNITQQIEFKLYQNIPNPVEDNTIIRYSINKVAKGKLQIFDYSGRTIFEQNLISDYGMNSLPLNTSSFSNGVYFYQINFGAIKSTKKLVILK